MMSKELEAKLLDAFEVLDDPKRDFIVHTGEKGYELFHRSFVRGVNISTFNMMHEMGEIDTNTWGISK